MAFLCQADLPLDKGGGGAAHSWHRLPVLKPHPLSSIKDR